MYTAQIVVSDYSCERGIHENPLYCSCYMGQWWTPQLSFPTVWAPLTSWPSRASLQNTSGGSSKRVVGQSSWIYRAVLLCGFLLHFFDSHTFWKNLYLMKEQHFMKTFLSSKLHLNIVFINLFPSLWSWDCRRCLCLHGAYVMEAQRRWKTEKIIQYMHHVKEFIYLIDILMSTFFGFCVKCLFFFVLDHVNVKTISLLICGWYWLSHVVTREMVVVVSELTD